MGSIRKFYSACNQTVHFQKLKCLIRKTQEAKLTFTYIWLIKKTLCEHIEQIQCFNFSRISLNLPNWHKTWSNKKLLLSKNLTNFIFHHFLIVSLFNRNQTVSGTNSATKT